MSRLVRRFAFCSLTAAFVSTCVFAQQTAPTTAKPAQIHFHEPNPFDFNDHTGFKQIFDGKTLSGWDGDPAIWRVEDGCIIGESDSPTVRPPNTYISYHGTGPNDEDAKAHDFDLKLEIKVELGGGSGIQYRGTVDRPWIRVFSWSATLVLSARNDRGLA